MGIRIKLDIEGIAPKVRRAKAKANPILATQVLKDSNFYIPYDRGTLEKSGVLASRLENNQVVWNVPYARRLYYHPEYNFSKDKNPHARGLWFEEAKAVHKNEWAKLAKEKMNENL